MLDGETNQLRADSGGGGRVVQHDYGFGRRLRRHKRLTEQYRGQERQYQDSRSGSGNGWEEGMTKTQQVQRIRHRIATASRDDQNRVVPARAILPPGLDPPVVVENQGVSRQKRSHTPQLSYSVAPGAAGDVSASGHVGSRNRAEQHSTGKTPGVGIVLQPKLWNTANSASTPTVSHNTVMATAEPTAAAGVEIHTAKQHDEERAKQMELMDDWLHQRAELNRQLETFGDPKTFIESNPPAYRTPSDRWLLSQLEQKRQRQKQSLPRGLGQREGGLAAARALPPRPDPLLDDWVSDSSEDEEEAAELDRELERQRIILRSMEAISNKLRAHKYRVATMFKRLDTCQAGYLSRADVARVFSSRAFHVEPHHVHTFLDQLDKGRTGKIAYGRIVPLDDRPWEDMALADRWPGFLNLHYLPLLKTSDLTSVRSSWGSRSAAVRPETSAKRAIFGSQLKPPPEEEQVAGPSAAEERLERHISKVLAPQKASETHELREHCQAKLKREYDKVVEACCKNNVTLNEPLLRLLLLPVEDKPIRDCVASLKGTAGSDSAALPSKTQLKSQVNTYLKSVGLLQPRRRQEASSDVYDSTSNYNNRQRASRAKTMNLSTGKARIQSKIDCWMSLAEYEKITRGLKTSFKKFHSADGADNGTPFWPGVMLDRLRLWMPAITDKSSPHYHDALANGGHPSYTENALFSRMHRQLSSLQQTGGRHYPAKVLWPIGTAGYVQHGSIDDKFKSFYP